MKTKLIFLSLFLVFFSANIFAQKQDAATSAVKAFYQFHLSHENFFNEKQIALRRPFLTPKLQIYFINELKRENLYHKKYPENKAYFQGLGFNPEEFCPTGYSIGKSKFNGLKAIVEINFKSVCDINDASVITYKIALIKMDNKWLIDDVIEDYGETLVDAFKKAKKIE